MATTGAATWSKTASSNATADPAVNWAEGMAPSAVNDSGRAMMASFAKWRDDQNGLTTGGSSTAYTVTSNETFVSLSALDGHTLVIIPHTTSGASPTLAVDGLTARAINISTGVAVPTGYLRSGTPYRLRYGNSGAEFLIVSAPSYILPGAMTGTDMTLTGTLTTGISGLSISGATGLSTPAIDDSLPIYDLSATANKKIALSDMLAVVNGLTADASPDSVADYVLSYDASATAAKKVLLANLPCVLPRGYIDGCILSNNGSDATNDIDISAGVCRDSTNAVNITVAASTKQLDSNWAAGTTGGMRNSAAGIGNTTYHIYAVATAAGVSGIYAHTSLTVATVLTALQAETGGGSYVYARRIGSIVRISAAIVLFKQVGDYFRYKTPRLDVSVTNQGTSSVSYALGSVPVGLNLNVLMNVYLSCSGSATSCYLRCPDDTDSATSESAAPLSTAGMPNGDVTFSQNIVMTDTSAQIAARATTASTTLRIAPVGYWDMRGKNE